MKRTVLFKILLVLYLAAVSVLCFADFGGMDDVPSQILGLPLDKVIHFIMFLPFPILALWSFTAPGRTPVRAVLAIVAVFLAGCLIAASTELIQGTLPYRDADAQDFVADTVGLAAGSVISIIFITARQKRKK